MTFGHAAQTHLENLSRNVKIKQRTRDYWSETLIALYKSWPGLRDTQLRNIRQTDLEKWAGDYAKTASATRYNNTVHLIRHVLNVGVAAGVLTHNVANGVHRISVKPKEPALPSLGQFNCLLHEMREGHGRFSKACADLAAGLAFTGCRLGEARSLTWGDIDFDLGRIVMRGNPETGSTARISALFGRLHTSRTIISIRWATVRSARL
jgi:integrase